MAASLILSMLLCAAVAYAAELHAQSKQYQISDSYFTYGYVSVTENVVVRPYNSRARVSGSGATDRTLYVYNGLGEDNYSSLTKKEIPTDKDCAYISLEKNYAKSGSTTKKYNNMKITSSDVNGSGYVYVKVSASY